MPVEIEVTDLTDKDRTAREVFESLAGRFPEIADLLRQGYTEGQTARLRRWHPFSLRTVLCDYKAVLRSAAIFTTEDWIRLVRRGA
jgi:hypothetical protein